MVSPGDAEYRREADAPALALGAHEGLEDALLGLEVDPRSVVGHANEGIAAGRTVGAEDEADALRDVGVVILASWAESETD